MHSLSTEVFRDQIEVKKILDIKDIFMLYIYITSMIMTNVLKTGPMSESEKLSVHGSLVGPAVEPVT